MAIGKEDLSFASIHELAPKIAAGHISPTELTASTLERAESLNLRLNAFLELWHEEAMAAAEQAEREIVQGLYRGTLHGIPIALKDLIDVERKRTTAASKVLQRNIASRDATVTARLKSSGAVIIGKTNLVEFAFGPTGLNPYTGDAHNPWDLDKVTGGSSSGSGAAVAAGAVYGALGSDTGGSIRMPASLCGIAGLKPTYGRVPRTGVLDLSWSQDHVGPMTRRTADCAHIMNSIAGYDPEDIASSRNSVPDFAADLEKGVQGLRLGVPEHYFFDPDIADAQIIDAVRNAIELLEGEGAQVIPLAMPWAAEGRPINVVMSLAEAVAVHERMISEHGDDYTPAVRSRILSALGMPALDYIRAQRARQAFAEKMNAATKSIDALLTPSVPVPTPTIAECTPAPGEATASSGSDIPLFTSIFDVTGQPSLSVNCGFDSNNMPIGLMITSAPFDENTALRIGHAYEELSGWHLQRPPMR